LADHRELVIQRTGTLLTIGPGDYKIPAVSDTPSECALTLLASKPNPEGHRCFRSRRVVEAAA